MEPCQRENHKCTLQLTLCKTLCYEQLQREVETTPRHDVLIVMGDVNAKIGEDNEGWEKVMGRHGLGRMNENGERLATFCGNNDLVLGGSPKCKQIC